MGIATALLAMAGVALLSLPDEVLALPLRLAGFLMCWGAGIGLVLLDARRRRRKNAQQPHQSIAAQVTGHRMQAAGKDSYRRMLYYVSFRTEAGEQLEFEVGEIEWNRLECGEKGVLEYQGWQYLGLRRYDLGDMKPLA